MEPNRKYSKKREAIFSCICSTDTPQRGMGLQPAEASNPGSFLWPPCTGTWRCLSGRAGSFPSGLCKIWAL